MISKIRDKQNRDKQGLPVPKRNETIVINGFEIDVTRRFNCNLQFGDSR